MKEAKQKVTSTAMYMVCLNLPPHLRYLPENVYLAGVIPGPGKPHLDQLNHFLALIVDELVDFWDPGVEYSRACNFVSGCRALAALVPLVCDVPATRQVAGLGSHNHTYFCSSCRLRSEEIENLEPSTWPPRDLEFHRRSAEEWRTAESVAEREAAFERNGGIRYSELLRLPYWDPTRYVMIDSMHDLYLGIIKNHIREIWGISVNADDGNAEQVAKPSPPRPDAKQMADATHCLIYGSESMLKACGTIKVLMKHLVRWRNQEGLPIQQESQSRKASTAKTPLPPAPTVADLVSPDQLPHGPTEEALEKAEKTLKNAMSEKTLQNKKKDVLIALCERRGLLTGGTKADLAQRLFEWRQLHISTTLGATKVGATDFGAVIVETAEPISTIVGTTTNAGDTNLFRGVSGSHTLRTKSLFPEH
ncbi:hypothetical protein A0H81_02219 [Grifola frondosa]|uniref:SAP domain-containing protein n=1 Tax=Grifola frondosa TaxID=5627 RepID=A0A1C7MRL7_GRIFR|nr:hypothetical protein A0H81_02219 [Grifola frondosa]